MIPLEKSVSHKIALKINSSQFDEVVIQAKNNKKEITFSKNSTKYAKTLSVDQIFNNNGNTQGVNKFLLFPTPLQNWKDTLILLFGSDESQLFDLIIPQQAASFKTKPNEPSGVLLQIMRKIKRDSQNELKKYKLQLKVVEVNESSAINLTQLKSKQDKIKLSLSSDQDFSEENLNKYIEIQDQATLMAFRSQLQSVKTAGNTIIIRARITILPNGQLKSPPESKEIMFLLFSSLLFSEGETYIQLKNQFYWLSKFLKNINKSKTIEDYRSLNMNSDKFCSYVQPFLQKMKEWKLLWTLNECNINNFTTISPFIEQFCHLKSDKALIQNLKKQVEKQESIYKKLLQKHKAILNILSKCINLQYSQIDKKTPLFMQWLPANQQRSGKMRMANIKKQENDDEIDRLEKEIAEKQIELSSIKEQHKRKYQQLVSQKEKTFQMKQKVFKQFSDLKNPSFKHQVVSTSPSLYALALKKSKKQQKQTENLTDHPESVFNSKGNFPSHFNLTKKKIDEIIQTRRAIKTKPSTQSKQKTQAALKEDQKWKIKWNEVVREVINILRILQKKEEETDALFNNKYHLLSNKVINKYKQAKNNPGIDVNLIEQCLRQSQNQENSYSKWIRDEQQVQQLMKQLKMKSQVPQTLTSIREN